jgi:hypothetical protein
MMVGHRQEASALRLLRAHHAYRRSRREMRSALDQADFEVEREVGAGHGGYSRRGRLLKTLRMSLISALFSKCVAPFDSYYYCFGGGAGRRGVVVGELLLDNDFVREVAQPYRPTDGIAGSAVRQRSRERGALRSRGGGLAAASLPRPTARGRNLRA